MNGLTESPLVGRSEELSLLRRESTFAKDGRGGLIFLRGPTGVGKSRLAKVACEEAVAGGFTALEGRGYRIDSGVPYGLWAHALEPMLRDLGADQLDVLTRGRSQDLGLILPVSGGSGEQLGPDAAEPRSRAQWALMELLRTLSARDPIMLLLDDLHWCDAAGLELLHFVARHLDEIHMTVLCTYNTDVKDQNPSFCEAERALLELAPSIALDLPMLSSEACRELIRQWFGAEGAIVDEFANKIHERTGGNPFFVGEIVRSLIESGRLSQRGGHWLGWEADSLELPDSVRDAVGARIEGVGASARGIADLVAAADSAVRLHVLQLAAPASEQEVLSGVETLRRQAILAEQADRDAIVYTFQHAILKEVLYDGLGLARRQALHTALAEALEKATPPGSNHQIAHHLAQGGDRSGRAVRYLVAAGQDALERRADREAVLFLQRALELREVGGEADASDLQELEEHLGRALQRIGQYDEAAVHWNCVLGRARETGDLVTAARVLQRTAQGAYWQGRFKEALGLYDAALAASHAAGDTEREAHVLLRRSICFHARGEVGAAESDVNEALQLSRQVGNRGIEARAHRVLMLLGTWTGSIKAGREHGAHALKICAQTGEVHVAYWVRWALAVMEGFLGNSEKVDEHVRSCKEIAEQLRSPVLELWTSEVEIERAAGAGRWNEALTRGEQAIAMARELHQDELLPRLLVWVAFIYIGRGELDVAKEYVDEAWARAGCDREDGLPKLHLVVPSYIGRTTWLVASKRYEEAIETGERGLAIAEKSGFIAWAVHRLLPAVAEAYLQVDDAAGAAHIFMRMKQYGETMDTQLGKAWSLSFDAIRTWHMGDLENAVERMEAAAEALEAIPFAYDALRMRRQIAGRLADLGRRDDALVELRLVHERLSEMGAAPELEKTRGMFRELDCRPPPKQRKKGAGDLTERELEIARLVAERMSNKRVAKELGLSPRTVGTHLSNIYKKLEIDSRGELADYVRDHGLVG